LGNKNSESALSIFPLAIANCKDERYVHVTGLVHINVAADLINCASNIPWYMILCAAFAIKMRGVDGLSPTCENF